MKSKISINQFSKILNREKRKIDKIIKNEIVKIKPNVYPALYNAMEYSLFSGGKRIRPVILKWCAETGVPDIEILNKSAAAVEYVHTYSLIHDDLPCMDDDDFRRGKPSCHKKYSESMAVLAGDALLTEAFNLISRTNKPVLCKVLAESAGAMGMVGGQAADIGEEQDVEYINNLKTAQLFKASALMGGICGNHKHSVLENFINYGVNIGKAFQLRDNILDSQTENVITTEKKAEHFIENAKRALEGIRDSEKLVELTEFIIKREK
ncbi:MAG: polyprenyl synthetase family protein [Elusimicrobiota bacterium]